MATTQATSVVIKSAAVADVVTTDPVYVKKLLWSTPTTVGDHLVVSDAAGNVVWDETCAVAKQTSQVDFIPPLKVLGLTVTTMDHGTLYTYLE